MTPPPRIQEIALRRLRDSGWIDADRYDAILRATRLAVDPQHQLELAIAIGHLECRKVPVVDTIDMIAEAGESANLQWSARRWRREHDRLSRMLAAKRLTAEMDTNMPFDIEWLERALPARSDPRRRHIEILDSPVRLAEESYRMAHCIASTSYVDRFRRGALGGVSVLAGGGKRWTVTVEPGSGGARPSIHAIHGRRNVTPDWGTRQLIRDVLGSAIVDPEPEPVAASASASAFCRVDEMRWRFNPRLI